MTYDGAKFKLSYHRHSALGEKLYGFGLSLKNRISELKAKRIKFKERMEKRNASVE